MSEEEKKVMKNDILFQIDMQLYDEFNDTLATMNDHLGDIYTLRDVEEVEQAEKDKEIKLLREAVKIQQKELNQEKEKNKWKPITEYNREKYDWVLVKYYDGDYECVPEVAEQRYDGKWYTSERKIPFEVKYFFDMQELLEE